MQNAELSERVKLIIKDAAKKMALVKRREYIASVTLEFFDGNARKAEREFGWGRNTIQKGIREKATGIKCAGNHAGRGRRKTEEKNQQLAEDIINLTDPKTQADPKFQTVFGYTRITAKAVRDELIKKKGYADEDLPCENTIGNMLNRLEYRLKRIQKTKPEKKFLKLTGSSKISRK